MRAPPASTRDISGWTFADNANTTGMFTGADTWLSVHRARMAFDTTDGPPGAWVFSPCLENERVESELCALHAAAGKSTPETIPRSVSTPGATFPTRAALKAAVDNCLAVDPTGVACCSHGADCGAAGTAEMADWDVSLVTRHDPACSNTKDRFNADISRWDTSSVTTMYRMFLRPRVQPAPIEMGRQLGHDHAGDVLRRQRIQHDAGGLGHIQSHGFIVYFYSADRMVCQVHGRRRRHPPRSRVDAQGQRVRRVPSARQRRRRQLHRHPRERHVLRPHVRRRVRAGGRDVVHRPGADRRLCVPWTSPPGPSSRPPWTRALDAVPSGDRCCSSDRLCWHPDPAMRRCGAVGCVDMPDWECRR